MEEETWSFHDSAATAAAVAATAAAAADTLPSAKMAIRQTVPPLSPSSTDINREKKDGIIIKSARWSELFFIAHFTDLPASAWEEVNVARKDKS